MIIYRIYHNASGKSYIGQTTHPTFNLRYSGGRWWDITDNPMLKAAAAKYGNTAFSVEILERNVESLDKLNQLEEYHADRFNAYLPHGYNLRRCGDNRKLLPHQIERISKTKAKSYTLRKVDTWELIEVTNLKAFCREKGIGSGAMYNMINENLGIIVSHGYCLPKRTKEEVANRACRAYRNRTFILIHEDGRKVTFGSLSLFAQEHQLEMGSLVKLVNGDMLYYRGWRLPERVGEPKPSERPYDLISPDGERVQGIGLTRLCRTRGLSPTGLAKVMSGDRIHWHGWHLASTPHEAVQKRRRLKSERPY